jgi:hypothetical protein
MAELAGGQLSHECALGQRARGVGQARGIWHPKRLGASKAVLQRNRQFCR